MARPTGTTAKAKREKDLEKNLGLFLKAALKRADMSYQELADGLDGFTETVPSIASKIGRGTFSATFLLAVMEACSLHSVNLSDVPMPKASTKLSLHKKRSPRK